MPQESAKAQSGASSVAPRKTSRRSTKKKPQGLGDVVEKVTEVTGIKAAVEALTDDCGCKERKAALNKLVPFPQEEYTKMSAEDQKVWEMQILPEWESGLLHGPTKDALAGLYLRAYGRQAPHAKGRGGCRASRCLKSALEQVEQVYMASCAEQGS